MSEQSDPKQPNEQQATGDSQQSSQQYDLFEELRKFSQQMEQTARGTWDNERTRSFQRDVSAGMQEFFMQIQRATKTFQEDPRIQNMTERGQKAIHDFQETQSVKDFQQVMARSVAYMNSQLQDFSTRMQQQSAEGQKSESGAAQNVPIDDESDTGSATTGSTVRLDPDDDSKK